MWAHYCHIYNHELVLALFYFPFTLDIYLHQGPCVNLSVCWKLLMLPNLKCSSILVQFTIHPLFFEVEFATDGTNFSLMFHQRQLCILFQRFHLNQPVNQEAPAPSVLEIPLCTHTDDSPIPE